MGETSSRQAEHVEAGEQEDRLLADHTGSRRAVILGSDAVAGMAPCSVSDVARMCTAVGFDVVAGPACGDELVARAFLDELADCRAPVAIACCCARVSERIEAALPATGRPFVIRIAPPPVAAARYLRRKHGPALHVTFVGECPGADDGSIDARLTPRTFVALLANRGVVGARDGAAANPTPNADIEPLERHLSTPGGMPARRFLARTPVDRVLRETDLSTANPVPSSVRSRLLLDPGAAAGCTCAVVGATIEEGEPPRSPRPLVVAPPGLNLRFQAAHATPVAVAAVATSVAESAQPALPVGGVPAPALSDPVAPSAPPAMAASIRPRRLALAATPLVVLLVSGALGVAAYAAGGIPGPESARGQPHETSAVSTGTVPRTSAPDPLREDPPRDSMAAVGSVAADTGGRSARVPAPRQRRKVDVVPGWLPQGSPAWTPGDTSPWPVADSTAKARTKPDTVPQP